MAKSDLTEVAARREDGQLVQRLVDAAGAVTSESEATVYIAQHGGVDGEVVLEATGAARAHFGLYVEKCRAAGGRYMRPGWRFGADVGTRLASELSALGFKVVMTDAMAADHQLQGALVKKFGFSYVFEGVVDVASDGFFVKTIADRRLPCTVGEALMLDEAGVRFSEPAFTRVGIIRAAVGFPNNGRAELVDDDDPIMDFLPMGSAPVRAAIKVGRNEPCPCGSGKKSKKCCDAGVAV